MLSTLAVSSLVLAQAAFPWGLVTVALIFFVLAIVAYAFGASGVAGLSAGIGRTLLFVFLVIAIILAILAVVR